MDSVVATESSSPMFAIEIEEEGGQQPNGARSGIVVPTSSIAEKQHDRSKSRAVISEDVVG